jgi:Fusaric acid resistance protein family
VRRTRYRTWRRVAVLHAAPIYRSQRAAARNGLRGCLAVLICAVLLSQGGWPFASQGLAVVGSIVALSAINPDMRAFAGSAVIAMVIAALLAGVMEFVILDGVDQFPLLAIGMAPSILFAALWSTKHGFLVLVFVPVILSPANPQSYNPEAYLYASLMAITAAILLFVPLRIVLPTSDALKRRWNLTSARAELGDLFAGVRSRCRGDEALFRDADRIGQLAALQPADADERRDDVREALDIFGRAAAVRRVRTALAELSTPAGGRLVEGACLALIASDAPGLRRAAAGIANAATKLDHDGQAVARKASADLIWTALLIDDSHLGLDSQRWITS